MAAFKPEALVEKLEKLNATQQSIETVSQWCIFFRKDAKTVVATWEAEFLKTKDLSKRLALVYLANDILQNSRKKGPQFVNEFYHKLPPAVHQLLKYGDDKIRRSMTRMIKVWEERRVFGSGGLKPFTDLVQEKPKASPTRPSGNKRHILLQGADATVGRLEAAMGESIEAHCRCNLLAEQCSAILEQDTESSSAEILRSGVKTLQQYAVALQNELGHRDRILSMLHQLASPHEHAKQAAEEKLNVCQLRVKQFQERLQIMRPEEQAAPLPQENGSIGDDQPMEDADAPKGLEAGSSQNGPQSDAADLATGATDPAALGLGGFSAADLVAQLSQSGTSAQMLLDALAALPKGGPQAGNSQPPSREEEEYDPELGM